MTKAVAFALVGGGALLIACNWFVVFRWCRTRKHVSMIPLVGGVISAVGCGLLDYWRVAVIAVVVDPAGPVCLILAFPIAWATQRRRKDLPVARSLE